MIDPNLVHRRSMMWLWWLVGVLAAGALLWFGSNWLSGEASDLETSPDSIQAPAAGRGE